MLMFSRVRTMDKGRQILKYLELNRIQEASCNNLQLKNARAEKFAEVRAKKRP